jgi:archaeosine synthase
MRKFPEYSHFQELILTSPLGVVPRQLENIYPVNCYDISVTGLWNQEEIEICGDMLSRILEKYDKDIPIICHLDENYREISEYVSEKIKRDFKYSKINQKTTDRESLESFRDVLESEIKKKKTIELDLSNKNFTKIWFRKFIKIIDYYYGKDLGEKVMEHCGYISKNYRHNRIELFESKNKNKLGIFKLSNGFLYLTITGAEKIAYHPNFTKFLVFDGDTLKGNTFFRPGVKSYGDNLLPDDPVVIFNSKKDEILAMGKMVVSSEFIRKSKSGRIAKIYESK